MCHVTSRELSKPFYVFCESLSCFTASGTSAVTLARSKAMTSGLTLAKSVNVSLLPYQTPAIKKKKKTLTLRALSTHWKFLLGILFPFLHYYSSFSFICSSMQMPLHCMSLLVRDKKKKVQSSTVWKVPSQKLKVWEIWVSCYMFYLDLGQQHTGQYSFISTLHLHELQLFC